MALRLTSNPRRTLFVGLLAVGALLIITFSATKSSAPRNVELSSNGLRKDPIGHDNALWSIPLASLTATMERPIFSPTRRPPPVLVKPAPTEAASTGQPSLALVGAIAGENDGIAIFLDGATKNIIRMASNIFEHVLALKMAQRPASVGILANQIRDFDSVREFFTSGTVVSITDLLFAIIFIAVLFMIGGALAFIPLFMLPVMIIIGFALQWPLERSMRKLQAESAARHGTKLNNWLLELIRNCNS